MKELTTNEVLSISLDILTDVHEFCISNNIRYTLYGGTLIGAIRNKGFIPWDDDIDIAMPRPDYEKFCKTYKSARGYKLFCASGGGYWSAYSRISEVKETIVVSPAPMGMVPNGVWIDLFPLDGAEDDIDEYNQHAEQSYNYYHNILSLRFIKRLQQSDFRSKLRYYLRYELPGKCKIDTLTEKYIQNCKRIPFGATGHVASFGIASTRRPVRHQYEAFSEYEFAEFENRKFCITKGYDFYLRNAFGDYMKLPPVEQRVYGHSAHKYYWKDK